MKPFTIYIVGLTAVSGAVSQWYGMASGLTAAGVGLMAWAMVEYLGGKR